METFFKVLYNIHILQEKNGVYMKRSTKIITIILASIMLLGAVSCSKNNKTENASTKGAKIPKIGISKLMPHPALDATEKGLMDYLAEKGIEVTYDLQNANGDISTSASIAQKFKDANVDIAVGIATPTAQALANVFPPSSKVPVIFMAVTDPVDAGLVSSWDGDASTNVCGVSDNTPVYEQIKLLVEITGAKTIGNIYASGEANGVVLMNMAKEACDRLGVKFVTQSISNTSEVKQAAQSIIDRVDAVYIATDNAVISALPAVDEVCTKANKPLFAADPSNVPGLNCLIAWGFNYYSIGTEAGKMIEKILNGTPSGTLGSVVLSDPKQFELWFNLDTAEKLGITIPQDLIDSAACVIKNGEMIRK